MLLYLVRHAIAFPHGTPGMDDDERPLTEKGIREMEDAARGICRLGYVPDLVLCSPLIRARQTAEILLRAFDRKVKLEISADLAPAGSRPNLYRAIRGFEGVESLMLVGHQPSLGEIAGELVWGSPEYGLELKKGGACAIELKSLHGTLKGSLVSLLTPAILRKAAC